MKKYKCACCGYFTLTEKPPSTYEVCPICYWEEDYTQNNDPNFWGGANDISLNEARATYKKIGAASEEFLKYVRAPQDDEKEENQD